MVIQTNDRGLPPIEKYSISYNLVSRRYDLVYFSPYGEIKLIDYQSYLEAEQDLRQWIIDWNLMERIPDDYDIQSDEAAIVDAMPQDLQDLLQDMDAVDLDEAWNDYVDEQDEPYEPYERSRIPYDPIRYE